MMPEYTVGMYVEWNKEIWEVMSIDDDQHPIPPKITLRNIKTDKIEYIRWTVPLIVNKEDYVK